MTSNPRIVFDTNVVVSGLLFKHGPSGVGLDWAKRNATIITSGVADDELREVFQRPKFNRFFPPEERLDMLHDLARFATLIDITETITACRDPKDDKFLELAVCGAAACIVTGDDDLLALHPFRGIPILTPQQFVEQLVQASV